MSGTGDPEDRGRAEDTEGREERDRLDVEARFAAIVARFHEDEPVTPRVVDAPAEPTDAAPAEAPADPFTDPLTDPFTDASPLGPLTPPDGLRDRLTGDPLPRRGSREDEERWRAAAADLDRIERTDPDAGPDDSPLPGTGRRFGRTPFGPAGSGPLPPPGPPPGSPPPGPPAATGPQLEDDDERLARIEREIERAVHGADGGHYVPPEPPPLPRPRGPSARAAWSSVLLGPLLLLFFALFWDSVPAWLLGSVVVAVVAGFTYLAWRLPRSRDRDDPDDGAIV